MKSAHLIFVAVAAASATGAATAVVGCSSSSSAGPVTPKPDGGEPKPDGGEPDANKPTEGGTSCVAPYDAAAVAESGCGHPGDKGNSLGVGQFCFTSADCTNCNGPSGASLCSDLGGPGNYFCTILCTQPPDAGADGSGGGDAGCGENATCQCQGAGQCGCTPNSCL